MNFRSKQLDSVFMPKAEITGPADHSIIKKGKNKKLKSRERTLTGLNNEIIMFLVQKIKVNNHEIIVVISMFLSP